MVILVSSIPRADDGDCDHVYPGTVTSMCSVAGVRHVRHHRVLELSDQRRRRCPPPPPLFKFIKFYSGFGVKLQKYWRVDPVSGKNKFHTFPDHNLDFRDSP